MLQFLKLRDPRELQNLSRSEYLRLRSHLKGVVVLITVNYNVSPKPIVDLVEEAGRQEFDNKEGVRVTVSVRFEVFPLRTVPDARCSNTFQAGMLMAQCAFLALLACGWGSPQSYLPNFARSFPVSSSGRSSLPRYRTTF